MTADQKRAYEFTMKERGQVPGLAHDFTRQLITEHRVSQDLYSRAAAAFGTAELVNMTFLIGHYLLTSALLNTFETPAPDQQADITKKG
jgi:4-carboxymuconolactone decarboxylase